MRRLSALVLGIALVGFAPPAARAADVERLTSSFVDGHPCVAFSPAGRTVVAFDRAGHDPGIWIASNLSGSWRVRRELPDRRLVCLDLAVDSRGKIHLLTVLRGEEADGGRVRYYTNRSGRWSSASFGFGGRASLAITPTGRAVVAVLADDGIRIWSNRSGPWRTSLAVRDSAVFHLSTIRLSASGVMHLAYATATAVRYATNAGGRWRTVPVAATEATALDLALDRFGRPHVAYQTVANRLSVVVRRSGTFRRLLNTDAASLQSIDVDSNGRIHLLLAGGERAIDLTNVSGSWRSRDLGPAADSSLALNRLGRVAVASSVDGSIRLTSNVSGRWASRWLSRSSVDRLAGLAVDASSRLYVAVTRAATGAGLLVFTNPGPGWASKRVTDGPVANASLAVSPAGVVHLAFQAEDLGGVRYATNASGSWAVSEIAPAGGDHPLLVLDLAGTPHVFQNTAAGLAEHTGGPAWTSAVAIPRRLICVDGAVDSAGSFHLACGGPVEHLSNESGDWTSAAVPCVQPAEMARASSIAVSSGAVSLGYATAFEDATYTWRASIATRTGAAWSCTEVDPDAQRGPDLAIDASGVRHAAISQRLGSVAHLRETAGAWSSSALPLSAAGSVTRIVGLPAVGVAIAVEQWPGQYATIDQGGRFGRDGGIFVVLD